MHAKPGDMRLWKLPAGQEKSCVAWFCGPLLAPRQQTPGSLNIHAQALSSFRLQLTTRGISGVWASPSSYIISRLKDKNVKPSCRKFQVPQSAKHLNSTVVTIAPLHSHATPTQIIELVTSRQILFPRSCPPWHTLGLLSSRPLLSFPSLPHPRLSYCCSLVPSIHPPCWTRNLDWISCGASSQTSPLKKRPLAFR